MRPLTASPARPAEILRHVSRYVSCLPHALPHPWPDPPPPRPAARLPRQLYPGAPHIWMTSTYVCDQNFVGDYGEAVRKIRTDPDAAVAACVQATGTPDKSGRYANDTAARERACRDGFFTSKNSKLLRDRMVSALQDERVHSVASLGLVDAFALTEGQCWASQMHDGRHYQMLVPAVVMDLVGALRRRLLPRVHEPRGGHEARGGHEPRGGRRGRPVTRGHAPAATTDGRRT